MSKQNSIYQDLKGKMSKLQTLDQAGNLKSQTTEMLLQRMELEKEHIHFTIQKVQNRVLRELHESLEEFKTNANLNEFQNVYQEKKVSDIERTYKSNSMRFAEQS